MNCVQCGSLIEDCDTEAFTDEYENWFCDTDCYNRYTEYWKGVQEEYNHEDKI